MLPRSALKGQSGMEKKAPASAEGAQSSAVMLQESAVASPLDLPKGQEAGKLPHERATRFIHGSRNTAMS